VIISKSESKEQSDAVRREISSLNYPIKIWECRQESRSLQQKSGGTLLNNSRWCAVVGIAKPDDFFASLNSIGIQPRIKIVSADHQSCDFKALKENEREYDAIITTEKDWARDESLFRTMVCPVFVLPVALVWTGGLPEF
jgi:tetraacyldisaccharide-1-P 4'-kinase